MCPVGILLINQVHIGLAGGTVLVSLLMTNPYGLQSIPLYNWNPISGCPSLPSVG